MSLLDDLVSVESRRGTYPGPQCTVAKILDQLENQDHEAAARLIDNPDIPGSAIAEALTRNGFPIADKTVLRHRKRGTSSGCRCPRTTS